MYTLQRQTPQAILAMRVKHGFHSTTQARKWSKVNLSKGCVGDTNLPPQQNTWPRNQPLLNILREKFAWNNFKWEGKEFEVRTHGKNPHLKQAKSVSFTNYPTIGNYSPTLTDLFLLPVELFDGYRRHTAGKGVNIGQPAHLNGTLAGMNKTGIGYKGLQGVSWLPSLKPIPLAQSLEQELVKLGDAIFLLYDAIWDLFQQNNPDVLQIIKHKVPARIPQIMMPGSVDIIRPDIMISPGPDESHRLVITELESCPAGQGMTHAMQLGYNLPMDMADEFASYLDGRKFVVLATHQWSEYVFDQAVFCQALRERGIQASIVFDHDLEEIHCLAQGLWRQPKELPVQLSQSWSTDFLGRLKKHGFDQFTYGNQEPHEIGSDTVIYRFGYFDNYSAEDLSQMQCWQEDGATIINPLQFHLESKSLMAGAQVEAVREWIKNRDSQAVEILDRCLAETRLLNPRVTDFNELRADRSYWLTKFAAWDGDNKSWGARSLQFGSQHSQNSWEDNLMDMAGLNHPVVAQHVIAPAEFQVAYADLDGKIRELNRGRSRLTPFLLRGRQGTVHCGSTITLRENTVRIHGASDAVEGPVIFTDKGEL